MNTIKTNSETVSVIFNSVDYLTDLNDFKSIIFDKYLKSPITRSTTNKLDISSLPPGQLLKKRTLENVYDENVYDENIKPKRKKFAVMVVLK